MKIDLQLTGLDKVRRQLAALSTGAVREASARAINDTAHQVRRAMQDEMRAQFDRPTPFILSSVRFEPATPDKLEATVQPTYPGGKAVDPQRVLAAEVAGGPRRDKRSEVLLRRIGLLPSGYQTAIPRDPFPGSDDGRGNLRGPFLVQLLSYFQAFPEQGYKANMTQRRKDKLANRGVTERGYKAINGVVYFVSSPGMKGVHDKANRTAHLQPGIWAKTGVHGAVVRPVVLFVRNPSGYKSRLTAQAIAQRANAQQHFERRMRFRLRQAMEA